MVEQKLTRELAGQDQKIMDFFVKCEKNINLHENLDQFLGYLNTIKDETMKVEILDQLAALLYYSKLYTLFSNSMDKPSKDEPQYVLDEYV